MEGGATWNKKQAPNGERGAYLPIDQGGGGVGKVPEDRYDKGREKTIDDGLGGTKQES